jgi:chromosome partitioning protein
MPVTVIANNKGGVGKTTLAEAIAAKLAELGLSVLFIDLDAQANATRRFGYEDEEYQWSMSDVLKLEDPVSILADGVRLVPKWTQEWAGSIHFVPGRDALTKRNAESGTLGAHLRLRRALKEAEKMYDHVIIDTPPDLGHLVHMALTAADNVVAVTEPEKDSVQGARKLHLFITAEENRENLGLHCDLLGVIVNKHRKVKPGATSRETRIIDEARAYWGDRLWDPIITLRESVAEAIDEAVPVQEIENAEVRELMSAAATAYAQRIEDTRQVAA